MYLIVYLDQCSIGSAGIFHLSKAKWGRLDNVSLGKTLLIKEGNVFISEDLKTIIKGALSNTNLINLRKIELMKSVTLLLLTLFWICC
jgi:hypothetical protein